MEDLVAALKVYSQDQNWAELKKYALESTALVEKNAPKIDGALALLDSEANTLAFLLLFRMKISLPNCGDFELLIQQFEQFIQIACKDQLQHALDKACEVCHFLTTSLIEQGQVLRGISLMTLVIEKCQRHPADLTSIHTDLLQLCLTAKCFKPALKFLSADIGAINKECNSYDTAKNFLLYYFYGGLVYLALKRYKSALFFFEVVVSTPATVVSHIMKEAYSKFVLTSILVHGKVIPLPSYVSAVVSRVLKPLNASYTELEKAYLTHDPDQLTACANKHQQVFQRHNNVGLVKQVIASLTKKNIQRLTKTFITLSLSDMAARVKLRDAREAENYVLEMIEEGTIYASIDEPAGMVSFHSNPDKFSSIRMIGVIDGQMRQCVGMNEKLQKMDRDLSVDANYVQKVMNMSHLDDAGKGDELLT